jgi:hypothetical protein
MGAQNSVEAVDKEDVVHVVEVYGDIDDDMIEEMLQEMDDDVDVMEVVRVVGRRRRWRNGVVVEVVDKVELVGRWRRPEYIY